MQHLLRRLLPRVLTRGLIRVRSRQVVGTYGNAPNGARVAQSRFNPAWIAELGLPQPAVIIDAGAFDGGDSLKYKAAFPSARILAIEADAHRANIVRDNVAGAEIEVIECAVQNMDGPVNWYAGLVDGTPRASGSIFLMSEKMAQKHSTIKQPNTPAEVQGRTLAAILGERGITGVDLLHMDIQGAEYAALEGLGSHRPTIIYLEVGEPYEGARSKAEVHRLLTGMGYLLAADLRLDRLYVFERRGSRDGA